MGVLIRLPQTVYGRVNFAVARRRGEPVAGIDWDQFGADDYARWKAEQAAAETAETERLAIEAARKVVPFRRRHMAGGRR